ncbi:alpha/beta-hydrolase [Acaromyces ingoldii]|uniref:Carboxypeptidase n=1 Tax=Acaromyces ingoldii TaxID=215250 RepID=A0A316YHL5_9BASI|nr:alpha/beta-hydrolase [Acaromyces ingoldii]PWN88566.1 alpha/beta-hydrolase [Acaromyces ingoldii]
MLARSLLGALACATAACWATQLPLGSTYREGAVAFDASPRIELPLASSSSSSSSSNVVEKMLASHHEERRGGHVVLTHSDFPEVSVRIKQVGKKTRQVSDMLSPLHTHNSTDDEAFCDPTVASYTGYIDLIDGKSLFFYFFESRSNPAKDPVMMWTNGGPGASSAMGLFQELGPCRVPFTNGTQREGPPINGTEWFRYSWNTNANVFFIDQPVGVGFSYTRYGVHTSDTDQGARDVYAFLRLFFAAFDKFQSNEFILSGESYAGRYLPRYASEIVDRNKAIKRAADKSGRKIKKGELINLTRMAIGNGLSDIAKQIPMYYDFSCTHRSGVHPQLSIETCKRLKTIKGRCLRELNDACRQSFDFDRCALHAQACDEEFSSAYMSTGRNPYNVEDGCPTGVENDLCYPITKDIARYLDRSDVREILGVPPVGEFKHFNVENFKVSERFGRTGDILVSSADYVEQVLERGIEVMIYVGKLDWICNHVGNLNWVKDLDWTHGDEFHAKKAYRWLVDGKEVGEAKAGGRLQWATVEGAGHMVPYDQPKVAYELLKRWLARQDL